MRRVLSFGVAFSLVLGGLYLLYFQIFEAAVIRGLVLLAAGSLIGIGMYWLWIDFIRPLLAGQRTI